VALDVWWVNMTDLLELSAKFIDGGELVPDLGPVNRITLELSEISDDIAMVESFSHIVVFRTDAGLVFFDATLEAMARTALEQIRTWSEEPVDSIVYTHGHIDHVGGGRVIVAEAERRGDRRPHVIGHEAVRTRFERYRLTSGYNNHINRRQFGRTQLEMVGEEKLFGPSQFIEPSLTYRDHLEVDIGGTSFVMHHSRGETDDHTWTWVPSHRAVCMGDLLIWSFPNAGNPQKVQRFPQDWARALREIAALNPELLLPAHGLPIGGSERVQRVLGETAEALEHLVDSTLAMMNSGAPLDEILHTVRVPAHLLERPWLRPVYDEPEFVVRNIWRFYGGWYDGNPARLKPPRDIELATEVVSLAGGVNVLVARAVELADSASLNDLRVDPDALRSACQLIEWAFQFAPEDLSVVEAAREIYGLRRDSERSLMAKGIFGGAAER